MAKKSTQQGLAHQSFVITTGYILFACMILSAVTNTIVPSVSLFFIPHIRFMNLLVFLVSLVISALLPAAMAYVIGDASTRAKNKRLHHYNGVVLAIFAYWVYVIFGQMSSNLMGFVASVLPMPINTAVGFMIPVVVTVLAAGVLAFYYHRGGRQLEITEYKPLQLSILTLIVISLVVVPVQQIVSGLWTAYSGEVVIIEIGCLLISYACLMRLDGGMLRRAMFAVVGLTLALIAQYLVSQFIPGAYTVAGSIQPVPMVAMFLTGFMILALYLYITRLSYLK